MADFMGGILIKAKRQVFFRIEILFQVPVAVHISEKKNNAT